MEEVTLQTLLDDPSRCVDIQGGKNLNKNKHKNGEIYMDMKPHVVEQDDRCVRVYRASEGDASLDYRSSL